MSEKRRTRRLPAEEPCRNCGNPAPGTFCPQCGQRKVDTRVSLRAVLDDVFEDQLLLNPAAPRTVAALLLHPGRLTNEYVNGRIARYVAPFRLYLVASVLFFLVVSFISLRALDRTNLGGDISGTVHVDSLRAELLQRRTALEATDTLRLGPTARALMRQALASNVAALAMLSDSAPVTDAAYAAYADVSRVARGQAPIAAGERQPWAQDLTFRSWSPFLRRAMERKLEQVAHLPPQQAVRTIVSDMLGYAPHAMFVLLPIFALLLKLIYIRQDRYYPEHFVFALHVHSFFFVMFCIIALLPWGRVDAVLGIWMVLYVWLAMKRVYGQGWFRTTVNWVVLSWCYGFVILFALLGLTVVTLLL
jgi:hypothetical protein